MVCAQRLYGMCSTSDGHCSNAFAVVTVLKHGTHCARWLQVMAVSVEEASCTKVIYTQDLNVVDTRIHAYSISICGEFSQACLHTIQLVR